MKGDGCRTSSEPSDGTGLYGSAGSGRDFVAMMMYCRAQLYAQTTSWFGRRKGTHVRIYKRKDGGIREAVPPVAQERGWHTCDGGFEWETPGEMGKRTKGKIVCPAFFYVSHPTRE